VPPEIRKPDFFRVRIQNLYKPIPTTATIFKTKLYFAYVKIYIISPPRSI
jgi:hypothetical protein